MILPSGILHTTGSLHLLAPDRPEIIARGDELVTGINHHGTFPVVVETLGITTDHIPPVGFLVELDIRNLPTAYVPETIALESELDVPLLTNNGTHTGRGFHLIRVFGILPSHLHVRDAGTFAHHIQILVHLGIGCCLALVQRLGCNEVHLRQTENRCRTR